MMRPIPTNIFEDYMGPSTSEQGRLIRLMRERPSELESLPPRAQTPRARSMFSNFYRETELKALKRKGLLDIVNSPKKYHFVWEKVPGSPTRVLVMAEREKHTETSNNDRTSPATTRTRPLTRLIQTNASDFGAGDGPHYEALRISILTRQINFEWGHETPDPLPLIRWPSFRFPQRPVYFRNARPTGAGDGTNFRNSLPTRAEEVTAGISSVRQIHFGLGHETPDPLPLIRWPSFRFPRRTVYFRNARPTGAGDSGTNFLNSRPTSAEEVTAGTSSASRNPDVQSPGSIPSVPPNISVVRDASTTNMSNTTSPVQMSPGYARANYATIRKRINLIKTELNAIQQYKKRPKSKKTLPSQRNRRHCTAWFPLRYKFREEKLLRKLRRLRIQHRQILYNMT